MERTASEHPSNRSESESDIDTAREFSIPARGYQVDNSQHSGVRVGDGATITGVVAGRDVHFHPASGTHTPFRVPYPHNPLFVGRGEVLEYLHAQLAAHKRVVVTGVGGLGKTQLAVEYAHLYREEYPGGIYWLTMQPAESIAGQIAVLAGPGGLNLPGAETWDSPTRIAAVRATWQAPVARLLVMDNLDDPHLLTEWQPTAGSTQILLTSRRQIWSAVSGIYVHPLAELSQAASLELLLSSRAQTQQKPVTTLLQESTTGDAAGAIHHDLGGLPLALALAAAYLEAFPSMKIAEYRQQLALRLLDHPSLVNGLDTPLPTQHETHVAATIGLSYDRLDPVAPIDVLARTLLHRLARYGPTTIPRSLAMRAVALDPDAPDDATTLDAALRRLAVFGLITPLPDGSVRLHQLVAAFARQSTPYPDTDQVAVETALLQEIVPRNQEGVVPPLVPYLPHLHHLLAQAEGRTDERVVALLSNLGFLLKVQGDYDEARPVLERVVALSRQVFGSEHPNTATNLGNLGSLLQALGDYSAARPLLEEAARIHQQVLGEENRSTAASINNLAGLLQAQGDLDGARTHYEHVLRILTHITDGLDPHLAGVLHNLATVREKEGDRDAAKQLLMQAWSICEAVRGLDHPDTARVFHSLGVLLREEQHLEEAHPLLQSAVEIREAQLGAEHPETADSLAEYGVLVLQEGDLAVAGELLNRALTIRERILGRDHLKTAQVLHSLGHLASLLGDLDQATRLLQQSRAIHERVLGSNHREVGQHLENLGSVALARGNYADAYDFYRQAQKIYRDVLPVDDARIMKVQAFSLISQALLQKDILVDSESEWEEILGWVFTEYPEMLQPLAAVTENLDNVDLITDDLRNDVVNSIFDYCLQFPLVSLEKNLLGQLRDHLGNTTDNR